MGSCASVTVCGFYVCSSLRENECKCACECGVTGDLFLPRNDSVVGGSQATDCEN